MNKHAVQHIVDSSYCFPVSPDTITLRLRTAKGDVQRVWVIYESKYKIAKHQYKEEMTEKHSGSLYDFYTITLKLEDTRIGYVFYLFDGEEYYFFSEDGLTKTYDYSLGYYNFFQYPYINRADILPQLDWTGHAVCYQIFVDRFAIGNESKDMSYVNLKWGEKPTPKSFAGGDLRGIINKLDYIRELGVNIIYLTPIFQSVSNHKYDISNYFAVDAQFGDEKDLKELVEEAHKRGMKILLDAVFNHCSDDLAEFRDVVEKGRESSYYDWFVIHGDKPDPEKGNYEMFATCRYMPKFNTSNKAVQDYLCGIGCHYIKEFDIDGWRLDVSDEVSHDFWRTFRKAVKAAKSDSILIGENWHDASNYLRGDQYDSIMNYAFTKACLDYFAKGELDARKMADKLNDILMRNTDTVNSMMLNLLDSHDTFRFYTEVKKDKKAMYSALALLFLFPGVPCIFYGTEFLTEGGFDPDCRRCMDWEGYEAGRYEESLKQIRFLTGLHQKYDLGSAKTQIFAEGSFLVVKRRTDKVELTLCINMTDRSETFGETPVGPHGFEIKEENLL